MIYIEILGVICCFLSVYFAYKNNVLTWPTGLVQGILFTILFSQSNLPFNTGVQIAFIITSAYGWYSWGASKKEKLLEKDVRKYVFNLPVMLVFATLTFNYLIHSGVKLPTSGDFSYLDYITLCLTFMATFQLITRDVFSWLTWIITDILSGILFFDRGLYFASAQCFILAVIAYAGYRNWNTLFKQQQNGS